MSDTKKGVFYQGNPALPSIYTTEYLSINKKNKYPKIIKNKTLNFTKVFDEDIIIKDYDQTSFAKKLFPNPSQCRDDGYICKINNQVSKIKSRNVVITENYKPEYLDVFGVYN